MTEYAKEYEYKLTDQTLIDIYKTDTILIRENDLKYKTCNNIDLKRVKGVDNIDRDTIEYRIMECVKNDGITLDLSHLKLTSFPQLPKVLNTTLKYLFVSENNIQSIGNLSYLSKLVVLDLCNNKLKYLPILPDNLEELQIKHNNITNISNLVNCDYLKRIDCSDNNIQTIPIIDSLEILVCSQNNIEHIPSLRKLTKLVCAHNKISNISNLKLLEFLDCDGNNLTSIENFKNLKELYCSKNNIEYIKNLDKIEVIHCYKTNVMKIEYVATLKELMCDYREKFILSKYFTIVSSDIYKNNIIVLRFK